MNYSLELSFDEIYLILNLLEVKSVAIKEAVEECEPHAALLPSDHPIVVDLEDLRSRLVSVQALYDRLSGVLKSRSV